MSATALELHSPTVKFLFVAVGLLAFLMAALSLAAAWKISGLRRDLKALRKALPVRKSAAGEPRNDWTECQQRIGQLAGELGHLREKMEAQERAGQPSAPIWAGETASIQLNRRGQILRLAGKGKSVAEIAADLGVSKGEVELLLKVQDLGPAATGREGSPSVL